ncbi:battenin isoform X1 [Grus americana]|uniref:battenin isoform X1 n=1 Tax=Grus americana TaxID=9117 RepID=UPI0024080F89|nr:battenin isoform X1 [Grus americana]XP_054664687.1 battenin isoform X1 [Grus americana]
MRTHRVPPSRFPHASRMRRPAPGKRGGERDHVSCGHVCAGSHDPQTAMAEQEPLLPAPPPPEPPGAQWRNGAAFWLLGLCNNLPYVLMLSAARDILQPPLPPQVSVNGSRYDCNPVSTGAVLLADILPTLLIKLVAPFVVHLLPYNPRVIAAALCAWGSFALVASAAGMAVSLGGVVLASAASGLGEVTFLALASAYPRVGVSCWSSGTGAAGVGGALAYGALLQVGLPLPHALLPALALPPLTLLSYFFLLCPPPRPTEPPPPAVGLTPREKWGVAKGVVGQAGPLALVYFAEYFINQGLLELLYFPASALTHGEQYRWYQLIYQVGVFASRSSLRCFRLRRVWVLALLQVLNALILLAAVAVPFLPGLAVAFAMVGGEGLLGGAAYANAFLNVAEQAPPHGREFAMTVASVADTAGIALAGGAALGAHGVFCPRG